MENLINNIKDYFSDSENVTKVIVAGIILLIFILFKNLFAKGLLKLLGRLFYKNDNEKKNKFILCLKKPVSYFFLIIGVALAVFVIYIGNIVTKIYNILIIGDICWILLAYFSNDLFLSGRIGNNLDDKLNRTAVNFIANICKVLTVAFAVVMIASEFGYNINGLITGLGVGGLAVSLAAQDAIGNMISGFIIIFDKPFVAGEEIICGEIHGFVEEVNMRSTKIRTLDDSLLTVPNSTLTKNAVTNISRMNKRRIETSFGLLYSTPNDVLEKIKKEITDYIISDKDILPFPIRLQLTKFDDSCLNYDLVCYTTKFDLDEYLEVVHRLNLKIKEIVENNDSDFAFPTTSVHIEDK